MIDLSIQLREKKIFGPGGGGLVSKGDWGDGLFSGLGTVEKERAKKHHDYMMELQMQIKEKVGGCFDCFHHSLLNPGTTKEARAREGTRRR